MIRKLNKQQKRELEERNRQFLAAHPDYYKNEQQNEDYESDHSAEIEAAKKGKRIYQEMNY